MFDRIKGWARTLKREIIVLWLAARDPRVPFAAKLLAGLVAGYALSPIDLIPDFIPVLGLLDDLILLPAGIWVVLRMIPADVLADLRAKASEREFPAPARAVAVAIVATWVAAFVLLALWYAGKL